MAVTKNQEAVSMTVRQYVDNPSAKGSAYLASRQRIKESLNIVFIRLLSKHRQQFYAIPYKYPNGDVLIHVKVPSEEYESNKIVYDVLFKIYFDPSLRYSLRKMKLFSNSPSFLFTYAYVYFNKDLIVDEFVPKLPPIAISTPPVIRNPVESLGFEKSTYIGARYMLDGFVLNDSYIDRYGKIMNPIEEKRLFALIADPEKLVQIYAHARELQAKSSSKPVDFKRRQKREELRQQYIKQSRASIPKSRGILKRKPQPKINARKARRSLMGD